MIWICFEGPMRENLVPRGLRITGAGAFLTQETIPPPCPYLAIQANIDPMRVVGACAAAEGDREAIIEAFGGSEHLL